MVNITAHGEEKGYSLTIHFQHKSQALLLLGILESVRDKSCMTSTEIELGAQLYPIVREALGAPKP